ncbi:MAG TPA: type II and III secretion system protein family protein [Acetobacteraceae bacterium]|nr:type II and III secretion system protein family protein [Acetobacteraceae bacterium]
MHWSHGVTAGPTAALYCLLAIALPLNAAFAQTSAAPQQQRQSTGAAQAPANPTPAPAGATATQPVSIQAGTGVLLRLPQAAATVMSAEPSVARVQPASPTSLFLMGVSPGRTTVIATTDAGAAIVQYDVTVTPGAAGSVAPSGAAAATTGAVTPAIAQAIQAAINRSVQGAGAVRARPAGSDVILTGTIPNAVAAQQAEAIARGFIGDKAGVIDNLTVLGAIQVNVRVRIAEINRSVTRQLGFNWQALATGNGFRFGLRTGAAATSTISPLLPLGLAPLSGATAVPNQLGAGFTSGVWDVNGVIDALAGDQLITILAEPNLTALSGETASFLAGGEFPIPIAGNTSNGQTTITVEFKTFGVSLAVVPTVMSPTSLNLRVRPEVSQLTTNGAVSVPIAGGTLTIPALTVRRAETTIELGSGQSFAIAGLLQKTSLDQTNALPWIGEVPVLGTLFKSNDFQRGESELVIIVTPYIVRPASNPSDLRTPVDVFRPATDLDRILFGRQLAPVAGGGPPLDAGFILK